MAKRDIILNIGAKTDTGQINQQVNLVINQINRINQASQKSGTSFANITGGNVAARAISETVGFLKQMSGEVIHLGIESVKLAARFEETTNALAVFTGSASSARKELAEVDKLAARTTGLSLESAEEGYQRLRALGFQAEITRKLVAGLGNQKILSGADNESVSRVIVNLTQIRASSKDASRDIKEMIKAIPSLSGVLEDAFGTSNTSKLRSFLQQDPKKFFDTLATGLANANRAEGGLNDSTQKLTDSFITAGRAFGEPILEPLTESLGILKGKIEENKSTWKEWGEYVGDIIRGANAEAKKFNTPKTPLEVEGDKENAEFRQSVVGAYNYLTTPRNQEKNEYGLAYKGAQIRKDEESAKLKSAVGLGLSDVNRKDFDSFFDTESNTLRYETGKEKTARERVERQEAQRELEAAKQKELQLLKDSADESAAILKNRYEREQGIRELSNRFTATQEINFLKESGAAKAVYLNSEIGRVAGFYNKQISLQSGNEEEIQKLTSDRNKKLSDLEAEKASNSAQTAKQIQDLENRIYEERRQSAIEFGNLQIRESESVYDKLTFNLNRQIERQTGDSQAGFDELRKITQSNYERISALTNSQYEKQLENLSLTDEQRSNIIKEMYLTEQDLAEQNNRKLLQIEDNRRAKFIENLTFQKEVLSSTLQSMSSLAGTFEDSFFNSSTFSGSRLKAFQDLALKQSKIDGATKGISGSKEQESIYLDAQEVFKDSESPEYLEKLSQAYIKQIDITGAYIEQNAALKDSIPPVYFEFERLAKTIGVNNVQAFDDLNKAILGHRQRLDSNDAQGEIDYYQTLLDSENNLAEGQKSFAKVNEYTFNLNKAISAKERLEYQQNADSADQYANSLEGLAERLRKLREGDSQTTAGVVKQAKDGFLREQISLADENIALEQKYYEDAGFLSDQYKNRRLQNEHDVFQLRQELSQKGNFDQNESDAKVLAYLNSQIKSSSEAFADFRIGLAGTYLNAITSPFDALEKKLEGLNPIVRGLAQTFLDLGKDIVKAFSQKIIMQLLGLGGNGSGSPGSSSSGGGFLSIIKKALGSVFSGSNGGGGAGGSSSSSLGGLVSDPFNNGQFGSVGDLRGFGSSAGGSSSGLSSIFGEKGFGNNVGTYGAIGAGAGILGGLVGGRFGGILSGAGSGLAIGASIGSIIPGIGTAIGAGVGAIAGGLISLLGGDPKRKKDKKENIPNLQKGFLEAFAELQQILVDSDSLKFNPPEEANTRADAVYAELSKGFDIAFESKKYKKEAQALIEQKRKEADVIRQQIRLSAGGARDYARDALALGNPVFATGNYFGENYEIAQHATRPHGFIAGGRLGVDRHLGLFADGETIINHKDRLNIITGAGYDVFKAHAQIPNYPKYADGNYFQPKGFSMPAANTATAATVINFNPNMTLIVQGYAGELMNFKIVQVMTDSLLNTGNSDLQRAVLTNVEHGVLMDRSEVIARKGRG